MSRKTERAADRGIWGIRLWNQLASEIDMTPARVTYRVSTDPLSSLSVADGDCEAAERDHRPAPALPLPRGMK